MDDGAVLADEALRASAPAVGVVAAAAPLGGRAPPRAHRLAPAAAANGVAGSVAIYHLIGKW